MVHLALGHDAPLAVTAMGGKFAIEDDREILDRLEVLWLYPGGTLIVPEEVIPNAFPARSPVDGARKHS